MVMRRKTQRKTFKRKLPKRRKSNRQKKIKGGSCSVATFLKQNQLEDEQYISNLEKYPQLVKAWEKDPRFVEYQKNALCDTSNVAAARNY